MLDQIHPKLQPYVYEVLEHRFGLGKSAAEIDSVGSSRPFVAWENKRNDRITFLLKYGNKNLRWQVCFDLESLMKPPDIISEDGFYEALSLETVKVCVPSLATWQPSNPKCLLKLLTELYELYKAYQVLLLKKDNDLHRCQFEYETLLSMSNLGTDNLEVYVQDSRGAYVEFRTTFELDVSEVPLTSPTQTIDPTATLTILFRHHEEITSRVQVGPELEEFFGNIQLPSIDDQSPLMEFLPDLAHFLQRTIRIELDNLSLRKDLFCDIAAHVEPAILEAETKYFTKLTFLLEAKNDQAVCTIEIPRAYPEIGPVLWFTKVVGKAVSDKTQVDLPPTSGSAVPADYGLKIVNALRKAALDNSPN